MTRRLYLLGRWCSAHGRRVALLWMLLLVAINLANNRLPPPPSEAFVLEGTNSATAQRLMNQAFPGSAAPPAPLVIAAEADLGSGQGLQIVDAVAAAVRGVPDVNAVLTPRDLPQLLASDGRTALLNIVVDERTSGSSIGDDIQSAAETAAGGRAEVALGGYLGTTISRVDTHRSEAIGLAAAVVILLLMLRRGWPAMVPLVTALVSVGIGLAAVGLLERVTFVPPEATVLGTMLGLGVGIDYALFLVTRHRSLLLRGFEVGDSAGRTAGTAGAGMVFAGGTLIAAVSGLALTGISFLMWLGFAAAIIVATAVFAALTLVPALFGMLGDRVLPKSWLREEVGVREHHLDHGRWARIADSVTGRPWRYAIAATCALMIMAIPLASMQFGQTDGTTLPPDSPGYRSTVLIAEGFGEGANGSLIAVGQLFTAAQLPGDLGSAQGAGDPRTLDPRLIAVEEALLADEGIAAVRRPVVSTDGGVAVWIVTPATGPADPRTEALVHRLREQVLPSAAAGRDLAISLGGITPSIIDLNERVADRLVPFIIGVVTLSFLLLMVAYRSLVIPLKAAAMNLLSIAAAYGVVVAIFQWGWGAQWIGLDGPVPIQSFVPMMMFAVLFGLSMDYEVFLLTSFSEHWQRTGDMPVAVRRGLADTGQVVTSAAAIMVVIFASFILTDSAIAKMFGVGLATAVLVDATIVRCLLVPALMVLAAKWTWWLPRWLDRAIPHLHVEGDPAALHSIHLPPPPRRGDPGRATVGALPLCIGIGAGWLVGASIAPQASPLALAGAAALGGVGAWWPRALPGAGPAMPVRIAALLVGILSGAIGAGLLAAAVPAVQQRPWQLAAAAIVPSLLLAALPGLRRYALPVLSGALALAVAIALAWVPVGFSLQMVVPVVAVTALVATAIALGSDAAFRAVGTRHRPAPRLDADDEPGSGASLADLAWEQVPR